MLPQTTEPWTVIAIPTFPVSEKHLELYKGIRLAGLRLDPQAFGSTFMRESAYTEEMWRSRIDNKGMITLLATTAEQDEAIGTLSIICPEVLANIPQDPPYPLQIAEAEKQGRVEVYMLVGMWVHTDHREKGIGRALVNRALEIIKVTPLRSPSLDSGTHQNISLDATPSKIVLLLVHNDQQVAMRLYKAAGFIEQGEVEHAGKASTWMAAQ